MSELAPAPTTVPSALATEPEPPLGLLREVVREGELTLNAALDLATAADLRASTLCGIFGTSAVTLEAAVLAYLASGHGSLSLVVAGALAGMAFFIAAALAALSGRPRDFYVAGGFPDDLRAWSWTGATWRTEIQLLDATGQRYAKMLRKNKAVLETNARLISASLTIGLASPIVGVLAYLVARTVAA